MTLERLSPCKINLILNILCKRQDGFHQLETLFQPVPLHDRLTYKRTGLGSIQFTCSHPGLPVDDTNLVVRAARLFMEKAGIRDGVEIHLEKRIPLAAGLAGGSANGAITLLSLNELFDNPLPQLVLHGLASSMGSDMPFFLQTQPALAQGRGEIVEPLPSFSALQGKSLLLIHPGFGVSTAWAYKELARFPEALNGTPGRASVLASRLASGSLLAAAPYFYNSLEAPVLEKHPILRIYQENLRNWGAEAAMMSGSGSTTFAFFSTQEQARLALDCFKRDFGNEAWTAIVALPSL